MGMQTSLTHRLADAKASTPASRVSLQRARRQRLPSLRRPAIRAARVIPEPPYIRPGSTIRQRSQRHWVGGTDTNTFESVPLTNPAVWNDLVAFGSGGAGGGGVSTEFTIPSYQQGVSGLASSANRNVPDIAGPAAYAALYVGGALSPIDGTSWSSPQFAAELSEITNTVRPRSLIRYRSSTPRTRVRAQTSSMLHRQ